MDTTMAIGSNDAGPVLTPNWAAAFNVAEHVARVPSNATIKGMFWNDLYKVARSVNAELPEARYSAFRDYPLVDYLRAVADVSSKAHPGASTLQAIRQIGTRGFATLSDSLVGRVLFAIAGRDLPATLELVSDAYKRSVTPGAARLAQLGPGRAVIELRHIWTYPLAYQVGVFEGAIAHFGFGGTVKLRALSPCDADYLLEWR
jgi:uncharacterized protein (TIGR02265 family)